MREAADGAGPRHPVDSLTFASALLTPPVILAIGLNYAAHSSELGLKTDSTPTVFVLWPNSLSGHDATTTWPRSLSESIDYEAELGVIIGTPAKDVAPEDALDHVWGYTVVNDITARDIQYSEAQWSRCKSFDGFTPTGPYVVTADEVPDPQNLHIWTVLDGHTMQDASTAQMVRPVSIADLAPVEVGHPPAWHAHLDRKPRRRGLLARPSGVPARPVDGHRRDRRDRRADHPLPHHRLSRDADLARRATRTGR